MTVKSVMKVLEGNNNVLERFTHDQLDKGKAESTVKTYIRELKKFDEWLKQSDSTIENVTRFDVQKYIDHLQASGRAASTIDRVFGTISVFAQFISKHHVTDNIRRVKKQRTTAIAPKSLTRNEMHKLFRESEKDGNLRNIAIIYTLAYTGLRVSELVALDIDDILISERKGFVNVVGKGNKERTVPLPVEARHHIQKYLDSRTDDLNALFISNYDNRISIRSAQRVVEKYGHHCHELRHTYCRNLIKQGKDIVVVSQLAGHESIEITKRYSMANMNELGEDINDLYI